jgi:hypothetical protein
VQLGASAVRGALLASGSLMSGDQVLHVISRAVFGVHDILLQLDLGTYTCLAETINLFNSSCAMNNILNRL